MTDNAPLRGGKGTLYEGGVRVPFIVRWPGVIAAGTTSDEPAIHVDLFPTFCDLAGASRPEKQPLDGVSLLPILKDPQARLGRESIYYHFPGYLEGDGPGQWRTTPVGTIRSGPWKLLEYFEDGRLELYNLKDDVGERKNLASDLPDKARDLREKLAAWRREIGAAMPRKKD
jgi:arylsulfatase A-like enzyme